MKVYLHSLAIIGASTAIAGINAHELRMPAALKLKKSHKIEDALKIKDVLHNRNMLNFGLRKEKPKYHVLGALKDGLQSRNTIKTKAEPDFSSCDDLMNEVDMCTEGKEECGMCMLTVTLMGCADEDGSLCVRARDCDHYCGDCAPKIIEAFECLGQAVKEFEVTNPNEDTSWMCYSPCANQSTWAICDKAGADFIECIEDEYECGTCLEDVFDGSDECTETNADGSLCIPVNECPCERCGDLIGTVLNCEEQMFQEWQEQNPDEDFGNVCFSPCT